jgi:hypothetical protein
MGTRNIFLASEDPKDPKEGLLIVYITAANLIKEVKMKVITTEQTFEGLIQQSEIKVLSKDQRSKMAQYLLRDESLKKEHETLEIKFIHTDNKSLNLTIKQRIVSSGILTFVHDGTLLPIKNDDRLQLCASLGKYINTILGNITELQKSLQKSQKEMLQWKETAQNLEKLQSSKHKLVRSTLLAWKENQLVHKETISTLNLQLDQAKLQLKSKCPNHQLPKFEIEAPDDLDALLQETTAPSQDQALSESAIQALATGRKLPIQARAPILDPSKVITKAQIDRMKQQFRQEQREAKTIRKKRVLQTILDEPSSIPPRKKKAKQKMEKYPLLAQEVNSDQEEILKIRSMIQKGYDSSEGSEC